jgi:Zn-dependent M16 (insulinase) family peptidase
MKYLTQILITIMLLVYGVSQSFSQTFELGKAYYGFKLIEKKFVKEVNSECYLFEHISSGAQLIKISNSDANKTFLIAFKTTPESDDGSPHIMEHSVLNGSKSFPVKSPFDILMKGSLNTFLNAMTGNDRTMYPVASMNNKDYFNLMNIYLDAVFNPLLYDDKRILAQEGWHYELTGKESPVVYRGIVYNEMKGAYSSPSRELDYQIMKNLFPDNFYRFSSGGYPSSIPELTHEKFTAFHKKYYHPSNSRIVIYGDADLNEELNFINEKYLKNYTSRGEEINYPIQQPFDAMKEISGSYSVTEGSKTENQTYLSLNFVAGLGKEQKLVYALNIISEVLVNQETAPIRKALESAGIGQDVSVDFSSLNQNVFSFIAQNANANDKDKFKKIILDNLKEASEKGLDREAVDGAFNRIEFRTKELNNAQLGLSYGYRVITGWNYGDNPFLMIEYENIFKELRDDIAKGYLEKVVKKYFLDNNHCLLLVLNPEPGLEKKKNTEMEMKLTEYKDKLSETDIEALAKETNDLIKYQKEDNTPEALATIPLLELKDIDSKAKYYEIKQDNSSGIPVFKYNLFTNNVLYLRQLYDMRVLPQELIPYASLLTELLSNLNTSNYSYGELEKNLNIHTGGFSASINTYLENNDDNKLLPKFVINSKAINTKADKMIEIAGEIVSNTMFNDKERLKSLLVRYQSNFEGRIKSEGYDYANNRLKSYFSKEGMFAENTQGIDYYWFITDLAKNFETNYEKIITNLQKTSELLFNKNNLALFVVCSDDDYKDFYGKLNNFKIPEKKLNDFQTWNFIFEKKNEGLLTASKVQYVLQGYNFKKLGYEWDGKMRVLNQVLMRDYLYNKIRVIGGAYGGRSSISPNGEVIFGSYRDPNLKKTFDNYSGTVDYLKNFRPNETEMQRYIIGTIARLDMPFSPLNEGGIALRYYYQKTSREDLQKERDEVLSVTAQDIVNFTGMIEAMLKQNNYCVYGNENTVNESKDLFNNITKIVK